MTEPQEAQPQPQLRDEWDEAAEFFTRFVRVQRMKATGFGHHPAGLRIQMSDRTYEIQSNGFITVKGVKLAKRGTYRRVS
jgi:hypothetical protein